MISSGATNSAKGTEFINNLDSYFGRINYNYDDKYLLAASIRRDGSSRFSPQLKYGTFPGVSVGWKISNEKFWTVPASTISSLKLRASYGELGNQNFADYAYQGVINSGVVYTFNGVRYTGGIQTSVVSETLQWEEKATTNVGIDAILLNNHLDFTVEYYNAKSTNILIDAPIPALVGSINLAPPANAASFSNKGIEIAATYHKNKGAFTFDISANLATVKNEVLRLGLVNSDPIITGGFKTEIGRPIGAHYGFVYEGIYQTQAEITAHAVHTFSPGVKLGDVKYKDISGPLGKPDGFVDETYDRVYLGSGIPKFHYGFNFAAQYKQFDFTLFASGSGKFLINSRFYRTSCIPAELPIIAPIFLTGGHPPIPIRIFRV